MKSRMVALLVAGIAAAALMVAPALANEKSANEKDSGKATTVAVLDATADAVHAAALEALAGIGAEVKKNTADYIEAKRPNKMGLAVGSGGEKLLVWIKSVEDGKTELKVTTKKTLLGIAGQKRWNDEVVNQVREAVKK